MGIGMTYYSAGTTNGNTTLLRIDGGFYDYHYKTGTASHSLTLYNQNTAAGTLFYWDTATATLVSDPGGAVGDYYAVWTSVASASYELQRAGELYDASFETVNIFFDKESLQSDPIVEAFLVSAVSLAQLRISYASDGNYTLTSPTAADIISQGSDEETGSLANSTVRYKGSKQVVIKAIQLDTRDAYSARFKVEAYLTDGTNTYIDDIRIKAIQILPSDMIFIGGETYA